MWIFARPVEKMVKPEFVQHVNTELAREMFWNVRLAIVGLLCAMVLYYVMLMMDTSFSRHITWFAVQFGFSVPVMLFFFIGEDWIKNVRRRVLFANVQSAAVAGLIGVGFVFQIPEIQNPSIKLTAFCLIVGVTGAAAFTFACNRFSFLLFALPWLVPLQIHLFLTGDLGSVILAFMVIPYVGVLAFLCLKDFERRVELISAELAVLEEKEQVITASKKLKESLDLVNELKTQQDGDYYLTSLLITPLSVNAVDEELNVAVDFLTKQKKTFEFKNKKRSLGGDISIAHTIQFKSGAGTVFLNADAMGKSMQGAGGALVLGAVFQSIIERTRRQPPADPESWLKGVFLELQKVFESFDCSMLVSMFIAVIENNTGMMYYLNAEHPWGVLYRNGRATFLQNRSYYRKLGTPGLQDEIVLDRIQLQPGDVVFIGSDGRDDLALPSTEKGVRTINEDESLFLKHVEAADGRLQQVYEMIAASGEITDDLSLVRVEFRAPRSGQTMAEERRTAAVLLRDAKSLIDAGNHAQAAVLLRRAAQSSSIGPRALRAALNLSMQIRDYTLATQIAHRLLKKQPLDNEVLYLAAFAERRLGNINEALALLEKIRQNDNTPTVPVLSLLAEIHQERGELDQARNIAQEILRLDPANAKARRLLEG
ncbi:MAG: SpoIIE family protein phosphatase [Turneriella sp.]|nr:SpoIIE family protein phosphatase [Turneriella sp.]